MDRTRPSSGLRHVLVRGRGSRDPGGPIAPPPGPRERRPDREWLDDSRVHAAGRHTAPRPNVVVEHDGDCAVDAEVEVARQFDAVDEVAERARKLGVRVGRRRNRAVADSSFWEGIICAARAASLPIGRVGFRAGQPNSISDFLCTSAK